MSLWLTIFLMGLITYLIRLLPIAGLGRFALPPLALRALRFVPSAVLTAIIVPELLLPQGTLDFSLGNARLLAGLLAALVAWRTKNVVLTVAAGMGAMWILEWLM